MSSHRDVNKVFARHYELEDKENLRMSTQSGKSYQHKIDIKKKGLSYNMGNCVAPTTIRSPIGKPQFQIYCDEAGGRSRLRARKNVCKKEAKTKKDGEEKETCLDSVLISTSRRSRSSSNFRNKNILSNNWWKREFPGRSVSETRGTSSRNPTIPSSSSPSKMKHLSDEVKRRTLSSIQLWKEKMRKPYTGTVPKTIVDPNNLKVDKTKSQKSSDIDAIRVLNQGFMNSRQYKTTQDRTINPDNINESVQVVSSTKSVMDCLPSKTNVNASTRSALENVRDNNRLNDPIEIGSKSKTPVYNFSTLLLTPTKVRYERRNFTHVLSAIKECELDGTHQVSYECDYLEDLPDMERKREENAPRLSYRFLRENVNAEQRRLIVGYLLRLSLHCHYSSHIIYQSVKLFDVTIDRILIETYDIQLTALACLWITLKREGNNDSIPSATTIIQLAKDLYIGREKCLLKYEKKILSAVKFNIRFGDPFSLLLYNILNINKEFKFSSRDIKHIYFCGSYLIDVSMLEESLCCTSAFVLAIAAIELSLYFTYPYNFSMDGTSSKFWRHRQSLEEWEERTLKSTKQIMIRQILERDKFGANVVHKKYLRSKHGRVSIFLLDKAMNANF